MFLLCFVGESQLAGVEDVQILIPRRLIPQSSCVLHDRAGRGVLWGAAGDSKVRLAY